MPFYYFQLRTGQDALLDPDGREFVSVQSMRRAALVDARSLIAADALEGVIDLTYHLDVEDSSGRIIHSVEFEDAVRLVRSEER